MSNILDFSDSFESHVVRVSSIVYVSGVEYIRHPCDDMCKYSFYILIEGGFTRLIEFKDSAGVKKRRDIIVNAIKNDS